MRHFAYNPNSGITYSGCTNYGNLTVSTGSTIFDNGLEWYPGPDESVSGYTITGIYEDSLLYDGFMTIGSQMNPVIKYCGYSNSFGNISPNING